MKKQAIYISILSLFIAFFGLITIMLGIEGQTKDTYRIELSEENAKIYITQINISTTYLPLNISYKNGDYDKKLNQLIIDNNGFEIAISKTEDFFINFKTDNDLKFINVSKNGETLSVNKIDGDRYQFKYDSSIKQLIFSHIKSLTIIQIILYFISFGILYGIIFLCLNCFKKFINICSNETIKVKDIILATLSLFIIYICCIYLLLYKLKFLLIIPIIGLAIYGIYIINKGKNNKLENYFILLAIIFGVSILFILPPFHVPDEGAHFIKSYDMSYMKMDNNDTIELTENVYNFMFKYSHSLLNSDYQISGKTYFSDLFTNGHYNDKGTIDFIFSNTKDLPILAYIPSTLIIMIGKILNLSPLLIFLLSRLINLLISIICCYFAIKISPYFKKVFFLIALLPIFIQQSAAINMDYLTNCISLLLIANIFNSIYKKEKINKKEIITILIISIILGMCKFGYFPILFLIWLIPNERFTNKKTALLFKILTIIPIIIISLICNITMGGASISSEGAKDGQYAISSIWTRPIECIKIYLNTFLGRFSDDILGNLVNGFGWSTKWHKNLLNFLIVFVYLFMLICKDKNNKKLDITKRVFIILLSLMLTGIIYSALFFCWTTVGSNIIDGLQARYFIPMSLLMFIGLSNEYIFIKNKNMELLYSIGVIFAYIISLFTIIIGFY